MAMMGVLLCAWAGGAASDAIAAIPHQNGRQAPYRVTGRVFHDSNGNGVQDDGEPGIRGIRVTAERRTAVTARNGNYSLQTSGLPVTVSVSFPSGLWPTTRWFAHLETAPDNGVDFGLARQQQSPPFAFVQLTDPHAYHPQTLPQVLAECRRLPLQPVFYVCTGDVRNGDPTVSDPEDLERSFSRIGRAVQEFDAPMFAVPGNHDTVDYGGAGRLAITDQKQAHPLFANGAWERYVGPPCWAFGYGGVRFFGLEFARQVGGKWNLTPPRTARWLRQELDALPQSNRTVLFAHNPHWAATALEMQMDLGLFGHSHTEGRYHPPGAEEPQYPENMQVTGFCQPVFRGSPPNAQRHYNQDGAPPGYRICVVERDRIDTFYKALDEPHTIRVNKPRRFQTVKTQGTLLVEGQFFNPFDMVSEIDVSLGGRTGQTHRERRRLWEDFYTIINVSGLPDGFHSLDVVLRLQGGRTARCSEPYLILTGQQADFEATGFGRLEAIVSHLAKECTLVVNGREAATLEPMARGTRLSVEVKPDLLRRLNRVSLRSPDGKTDLRDVSLRYGGELFVDQHRVFRWMFDSSLRPGRALFFDLNMPGPAIQWLITVDDQIQRR